MDAFYFGESPQILFGAYHAPYAARDRRSGILICSPMGQEYVRSHRSFRQLATRLAASGFHVMRFDFFGSGDSSGNSDEGDVTQWLEDISAAIEEFQDYGDIQKISVIGLRFGATLAALYGTQKKTFDSMVLWDPVIEGSGYLSEVSAMHDDWLKNLLPKPPENSFQNDTQEILGFPFSEPMYKSIENSSLLSLKSKPARRVFIIESDKNSENERLKQQIETSGAACSLQTIPGSRVWRKGEALNSILMPNETLHAIIDWIEKS